MGRLLYSEPNITHNELNLLPTPEGLGRFHHPYPFGRYVDDIKEALDINGLVINDEEYEVVKDNQRLFGVLEVSAKEGELITSDEWKILVGLRGSHDQRLPRQLTLGSQVLVCSNLCFNGNLGKLSTKQTTNIGSRLPGLIRDAVAHIPELSYRQEQTFDRYKEVELKPRQGDAALVELHRRGALSAPQLSRAIQEWDSPTYEEHGGYGDSVWKLFNACTESLKPTGQNSNPALVADRSAKISTFLDEVVGL